MKTFGTIFIISAPSGAGKSSLIKKFLESKYLDNIYSSISYTTREIRNGEIEGVHYHFVSKKKFKNLINKNFFLEYAKVFKNFYGTSLNSLKKLLKQGIDVFLDIDWQGAKEIKKKIPSSKSIFILPPSKKDLYKRLKKRNRDKRNIILNRLKNSSKEISHLYEYDYLIINDNFKKSLKAIKNIILSNRLLINHQIFKNFKLIKSLLF
ncbi:guanylate kinase [Buchnera aphidicola]|uniref:guanylate kinase n=1 Tax=Buchnera aphidicola TaxID=9 RepID=UPI0030EE3207